MCDRVCECESAFVCVCTWLVFVGRLARRALSLSILPLLRLPVSCVFFSLTCVSPYLLLRYVLQRASSLPSLLPET